MRPLAIMAFILLLGAATWAVSAAASQRCSARRRIWQPMPANESTGTVRNMAHWRKPMVTRWTAFSAVTCIVLITLGCVIVRVAEPPQFGERIQTDVEMMRQALAEVRAIGVAFESFAADNNRYPTAAIAGGDDRTVGGFALQEVRRLPGDVFKIYTRMLPKRDPWESPYLFWSDGQHYAVICLGADSSVARPAQLADLLVLIKKGEEIDSTSSHCLEDEIVFANGAFVWWPKDMVRRCGDYGARDPQTPPHRAN